MGDPYFEKLVETQPETLPSPAARRSRSGPGRPRKKYPRDTIIELDPRWNWVEVRKLSGQCRYIRGQCNHLERVDVESYVTGELVAQLCLTCDTQLPARMAINLDPPTYDYLKP